MEDRTGGEKGGMRGERTIKAACLCACQHVCLSALNYKSVKIKGMNFYVIIV